MWHQIHSSSLHVNHFRVHHNVSGLRFKCCVPNCVKTIATNAVFSTHMSTCHENASQGNETDIDSFNVILMLT